MHYYPHHIGDFIRDTSRLSDSQSMAYLRLLWTYYDTETPLPNTPAKLAFQIGASASDVELILDHFFVLDGDVWRHARVEKEIGHFRSKAEKAAASAKARWSNAKAMRSHNGCNTDAGDLDANQEPRTKNQEPSLNKDSADKPQAPAKASRKSSQIAKPESVEQQVWDDFLTMRKAKGAPVTATALSRLEAEAVKARMSVQQAMETCCAQGWRGFKAEWVAGQSFGKHAPAIQPKSFAQQERETGWLRWEEMTGRKHPEMEKIRTAESGFAGDVIDITPRGDGLLLEG